MASHHAPQEWKQLVDWLAAPLHGWLRWRLSGLRLGTLFASGRRVVAAGIRAAGLSHDFRNGHLFLQSVGRWWRQVVGTRLLVPVLLRVLKDEQRVLLAVDDSPARRFGPKVQGAGLHHDLTPGPGSNSFCNGHVWVTLAVVLRHSRRGTIGLCGSRSPASTSAT